jgi:uncharacterized protein (TIGR03084 family)
MDLDALLDDLDRESGSLDDLVATRLDDWARPTPAAGWSVAHQIGHLAWTDDAAVLAAARPEAFTGLLEQAMADPAGFVDGAAEAAAAPAMAGADGAAALLATWRTARADLVAALRAVPVGGRVPWFGPPMSPASMATARLMETWAHGQDVADAFGVVRAPSDRLRHVAHLAVRARGYAYTVHGEEVPATEVAVVLTAPDGHEWTWGDPAADQRVTGPALDFCLLATRRRHRDDLSLRAEGSDAEHWLTIIQAFAGPPGEGRGAAGPVSA